MPDSNYLNRRTFAYSVDDSIHPRAMSSILLQSASKHFSHRPIIVNLLASKQKHTTLWSTQPCKIKFCRFLKTYLYHSSLITSAMGMSFALFFSRRFISSTKLCLNSPSSHSSARSRSCTAFVACGTSSRSEILFKKTARCFGSVRLRRCLDVGIEAGVKCNTSVPRVCFLYQELEAQYCRIHYPEDSEEDRLREYAIMLMNEAIQSLQSERSSPTRASANASRQGSFHCASRRWSEFTKRANGEIFDG